MPKGLSRGGERQYRSVFPRALDKFMEEMNRQLSSGETPTLQEGSFFGNYPWEQELAGMTPGEKGLSQGRYAPYTRWRI